SRMLPIGTGRPKGSTVRADLDSVLEPVLKVASAAAAEVDAEGVFPEAAVDALRVSGLLGLTLPAEVGGLGAGPVEFSEVVYALAEACGSTAVGDLMHARAPMTGAAAPPAGTPALPAGLTRRPPGAPAL